MSYYDKIKRMAEQYGVSYRQLIALSPQNDPFYAGTPGDCQKAEWFADIWRRTRYSAMGAHLRRVHYWIVSQAMPVALPYVLTWDAGRQSTAVYLNNEPCWKFLCLASKLARYMGLVRIADIRDNKSPKPHIYANYQYGRPGFSIDTPATDGVDVSMYGFNQADAQPYHLEVWCEKSTMDDVLLPVCQRHIANLVTFEGEVSVTACHDLVQRISKAMKPVRIFYISDFDPAGNSMPVAMSRKAEYLIRNSELSQDVKIKPIALTPEQVEEYDLPRIPIKETEMRAARFEDAFGAGATELDALEALHPGELADIVSEALSDYYSETAARSARKKADQLEREVKEQVDEVTSHYAAELEALRGMIDELEDIHIDTTAYTVTPASADVEEEDDWLFDSQRDYVEQIAYYKAHKGAIKLE